MGLAEFNARVSQIRDMITQHGIDLKSDKLEFEIARLIAKHYDTLKEYDIIQVLNEISDNLDSKLTYAENMEIAEKIIGQYLSEDKYSVDYVESYEEALEHWNRQLAQELTQQYFERQQENAVDWDKVLKPQVKSKYTALPVEVSEKPIEKPQVNAKPMPKVKVIKYKPEIPEIAEIKEKVNTLETQITLLDSKLTQLANAEKPNTDNHKLIERVERVEKDLNEIKEKLSQLEIAFNNILMGELRDIKAKVEELRKAEFKPVTVDNRAKPEIPEQEEKLEDRIQRKIVSIGKEVTLKAITTSLNGLNAGFKAYIQGLNYLESARQKPSKKRVNKTAKM